MDINGTSLDLETSLVHGDHNTLSDIRCKFPHSLNKRSTTSSGAFITGYKIAISNNNRTFSDAHAIYILDSTCQDTMNVSGQLRFVLKVFFFDCSKIVDKEYSFYLVPEISKFTKLSNRSHRKLNKIQSQIKKYYTFLAF